MKNEETSAVARTRYLTGIARNERDPHKTTTALETNRVAVANRTERKRNLAHGPANHFCIKNIRLRYVPRSVIPLPTRS